MVSLQQGPTQGLMSVSPSGFVSSFLDQSPSQGGPSTMNELAISVVAISGSEAVIRLSPT